MTKKERLAELKEEAINIINTTLFDKDIALKYNLKVKADHNKEFIGEGYLISIDKPFSIFDIHSKIGLIWNEESNNIYRVNTNFISFIDKEEIMTSYKEWAISLIESLNTKSIVNDSLNKDYSLDTFLNTVWIPSHPIGDYSSAKDISLEKHEEKVKEYKDKKIADLSKWAASHTNKKGDATIGVAESIYKKFYTF